MISQQQRKMKVGRYMLRLFLKMARAMRKLNGKRIPATTGGKYLSSSWSPRKNQGPEMWVTPRWSGSMGAATKREKRRTPMVSSM